MLSEFLQAVEAERGRKLGTDLVPISTHVCLDGKTIAEYVLKYTRDHPGLVGVNHCRTVLGLEPLDGSV